MANLFTRSSKEEQAKKVKALLDANPGLAVTKACKQEGITPNSFYRWFPAKAKRGGTRAKKLGRPVTKTRDHIGTSLSIRSPSGGIDKFIPAGYTTMVVPTSVAIAFLENQQ